MTRERIALCMAGAVGGIGVLGALWFNCYQLAIGLGLAAVIPTFFLSHIHDVRTDWDTDVALLSGCSAGVPIGLAVNALLSFVLEPDSESMLSSILLWAEGCAFLCWSIGGLLYDLRLQRPRF